MVKKTDTAIAKTAYGKTLDTPIRYDYEFETYEGIDEVRSANDTLSDAEVVEYRNTQRKNNARQKALQAALDAAGIERPTMENDDQLRLRNMVKVILSDKTKQRTEQEARELASTVLGVAWLDE